MSSLILNPSMQDVIFNGGSCQLYWNQEMVWPTGSPGPTPEPVPADCVKIGNQIWKKENMSINDGGTGISVVDGAYYYTPTAAARVAATVDGFHIPTIAELKVLKTVSGGPQSLMSTTGWTYLSGNNSTGFNAKPYGLREWYPSGAEIELLGEAAIFHASDGDNALIIGNFEGTNVPYFYDNYGYNGNGNERVTVRLIKDS